MCHIIVCGYKVAFASNHHHHHYHHHSSKPPAAPPLPTPATSRQQPEQQSPSNVLSPLWRKNPATVAASKGPHGPVKRGHHLVINTTASTSATATTITTTTTTVTRHASNGASSNGSNGGGGGGGGNGSRQGSIDGRMQKCGLCSLLARLLRRAMCVSSRRGSGESYYQELAETNVSCVRVCVCVFV